MVKTLAQRATPQAVQFVREGATTVVRVHLPALDPPANAFHADWYWSEKYDGAARFVFGKLSAARKSLTAVVEVTLSDRALLSVRESIDAKNFSATLETYLTKNRVGGFEHGSAAALENLMAATTKEASFVASMAFIGYAESDAALTFFRMPPGAEIQAGMDATRVRVTPLVRIDVSTALLRRFCEDVRGYQGAKT